MGAFLVSSLNFAVNVLINGIYRTYARPILYIKNKIEIKILKKKIGKKAGEWISSQKGYYDGVEGVFRKCSSKKQWGDSPMGW